MKRFALVILGVILLEGIAHAGPYILCYKIVPSGQLNSRDQMVRCAEVVKVTEWQRDSFYSEEFNGQNICPKGTYQRVYQSIHEVGDGLSICPHSRHHLR